MRNARWFQLMFPILFPCAVLAGGKAEHVVVVVWDGMRPDFISVEHTPTLHQLAQEGVFFQNHHAVFCSSTEVNGTAMATGAYPEHSGIIANRLYFPDIDRLQSLDTQDTEVVRKGDGLTGGHYLMRATLAETLQAAGKRTVIAGSKGVALLHDRRIRPDDSDDINLFEGKSLPGSAAESIRNLLGNFPGSSTPNEARDKWTTQALFRSLWSNGVPAFTLLWLSEPDLSQHAAGPGSTRALAALASSDRRLAEVLAELERRGVRKTTDVFVVSDHGFSTAERSVEVDNLLRDAGFHAHRQFKSQPKKGDIMVVGQGAAVLFYVIEHDAETIRKLTQFLQQQDFSGTLFTRGAIEGTFSLAEARIDSSNAPDVVLSMRWSDGKSKTGAPGLFVADGNRLPGQGAHAGLSRFDLHNTLIGAGPDLKIGFTDTAPSGNIDLAPTILWILGVKPAGPIDGRVLSEALTIDAPPMQPATTHRIQAQFSDKTFTWHQYLQISQVNGTVYLDEGNGECERK